MRCLRNLAALVLVLAAGSVMAADDAPVVITGHGIVHKVDKETLTIKHRTADGKFEKDLVLKLTGTSRFSHLSTQKRGDKTVLVQKDIEVKGLAEKQTIAVIYADNGDDHVLLAAVVH